MNLIAINLNGIAKVKSSKTGVKNLSHNVRYMTRGDTVWILRPNQQWTIWKYKGKLIVNKDT